MAAAPETQAHEGLHVRPVLADVPFRKLVNFLFVNPDFAVFENDVLAAWRINLKGSVNTVVIAAEVDLPLLHVRFIHYLLILVPLEVCLGRFETAGSLVHCGEHWFQVSAAVRAGWSRLLGKAE